ncbi:manganese ABC transporter, inner membrane permease protein SitD [Klebsiella pneumoniae subsp. pneumoniae]|uniref:Manganese ABC transporter, inner membrane permease protein SitD n=1 Tax=Klebsiella pneumoniae subsp. pneumoniae TaxID=72407 RepID=A0A377Z975_KLEPN|nr:manganese ABC transporter, inner membrane permease protein SitD [Klebsiella pneumoniae subsp. pneumoniae]
MLNLFLAPFQFPFMVNAIAISIVVAIPCALLSVFLVLKGWALMGDAMSHAVFPGVVLAYIIGIPFAIGAFIAGLLCAVTTGFLDDNSRLKRDTIMGIVFSGMFGAGLVLYVAIQSDVHLDHILFGDMLGISLRDIGQTTAIALVIALIIGLKWRDFLLHAFDPTQAKASGLRGGLLHYGLLCMIALTIVATLQSVGIILSISLLIAPGAIALLLVRRFIHALLLAVAVAIGCSAGGCGWRFISTARQRRLSWCCLPRCLWSPLSQARSAIVRNRKLQQLSPVAANALPGLQEHDLSPGCAALTRESRYFFGRYFSGSGGTGRLSSSRWRIVRIGWRQSIRGPAQRIICFISSRFAGW